MTNNSLAFIALCNEYCFALENARETTRNDFVGNMLRLLPRIYISATDLRPDDLVTLSPDDDEVYIESYLDEDYYDAVRRSVETLMGPDDVYLETFEEDMKYSDTPVSASISENLADIFQVLYNFTEMVKNSPEDLVNGALKAVKEEFESYWSQPLCNVLRAINHIRYNTLGEDTDDEI